MTEQHLYRDALELLQQLIRCESFSTQEDGSATLIADFLQQRGIEPRRSGNNVWAVHRAAAAGRPAILLNSHHDTVRPNAGWTCDPFEPTIEEGKLIGLGSNDAGGCLVSLLSAFVHCHSRRDLPFNLIIAATAEEENSGPGGVESILPELGAVDLAIVGEPTQMQPAIAEKGLMVLDCTARGRSGHAARDSGENAIVKAIEAIDWFHSYRFPAESALLGPVRMTVTMIEAGSQHNVIPDSCRFTVDVRTTDACGNSAVLEVVRQQVTCEVQPRSMRLNASAIPTGHPVMQVIGKLGLQPFGSPTTSDQAVIPFPSLKMGPGRSERSHTADEFIYLDELRGGIAGYLVFLDTLAEFYR